MLSIACIMGASSGSVASCHEKKPLLSQSMKPCSSGVVLAQRKEKLRMVNIKNTLSENAVAGGLAGTIVSCCLHPVDTIKTVIQAQKGKGSLFPVVTQLLKDRGITGLYRGIGSNLLMAAPISAIYTSTYESVKEVLLPRIPKRYHAVAHCAAGACASVATSVVYTPTECVKQRMQVGRQYSNSAVALFGILRNEGLRTLYGGWTAVLLRNVPNSILKFLTYEGLKHWAMRGRPEGTRPNSFETLAIGGAAGTTAAFFTTPFDLIKTRLQTQVPGTGLRYRGVGDALQRIVAEEGALGLYRGVVPRLFIYLSQGAIFFASYELIRRMLAKHNNNKNMTRTSSHLRSSPHQQQQRPSSSKMPLTSEESVGSI